MKEEYRPQPSKQPEQAQPLQGRAVGRESLQGPTAVDGSVHGRSEITSVQEHLDGHELDAIARHGNKGKAHSPEHRAKISEGVRRNWQSRKLQPPPESAANKPRLTPEERKEKRLKYQREYQKRYRSHDPSIRHNEKLRQFQWQRHLERMRQEQEAIDQSTDLGQRGPQQSEVTQIFPDPPEK